MKNEEKLFELAMNMYLDSGEMSLSEIYRKIFRLIAEQAQRDGFRVEYLIKED